MYISIYKRYMAIKTLVKELIGISTYIGKCHERYANHYVSYSLDHNHLVVLINLKIFSKYC